MHKYFYKFLYIIYQSSHCLNVFYCALLYTIFLGFDRASTFMQGNTAFCLNTQNKGIIANKKLPRGKTIPVVVFKNLILLNIKCKRRSTVQSL